MNENGTLANDLRDMIIEACNLEPEGITREDIEMDTPLVGPQSPVGIDSLDAIEIVAAVEKRYGVRINNVDTAQQVLRTLRCLVEFISEKTIVKSAV